MNLRVFFCLVVSLLISLPALSADNAWYAGLDVGVSRQNVYSQTATAGIIGVARVPNDPSLLQITTAVNNDEDDQGFKITVGHQFAENLAIEFSYVDLGEFRSHLSSSQTFLSGSFGNSLSGNIEQYTTIATDQSESRDVDGFNLNLVGKWPLSETISFLAKVGIYSFDSERTQAIHYEVTQDPETIPGLPPGVPTLGFTPADTIVDIEDGGSEISYGLGLSYKLADAVEAELEYQFFKDVSNSDIGIISLGFSYHF